MIKIINSDEFKKKIELLLVVEEEGKGGAGVTFNFDLLDLELADPAISC